jgi:hypothetical protein
MNEIHNKVVPPGKSGRPAKFDASQVTLETMASELALLNLGDFEPLNIKIDTNRFMLEISQFDNAWVDYLPRTDRPNNRQGLVLSNLPGKSYQDNPSLPQASMEAGRRLSENDFNQQTEVYSACTSLHPLLDEFQPLGRTFLVKSNVGGYFVPHRDHPSMPRDSFRIAVFLNNCAPLQYDWLIDTDRKLSIELGRAYYINTRKTHRTMSWVNDSIHLIINIPFTPDNVAKVIAHLQHSH